MQRAMTGVGGVLQRIFGGERAHLKIGVAVVVVAILVLATAAYLYVVPPNRKSVSFESTDVSSLDVGTDVRIAGIDVGKVTKMTIEQSAVKVTAKIDANAFVGDQSRVDVRLLTPVGGYAVTLIPLGSKSLGSATIPNGRVSVPYTVADVLQAAPNVTGKVNGGTVDANIKQVAAALQQNPDSVGSIIDGMKSITTVMNNQRAQVRNVMDMASNYLNTFNASRDFVFGMLRDLNVVVTTYNNTYAGFNDAYRLLGEVLYRVGPLENFYLEHEPQVRPLIYGLRDTITEFQKEMGPAISNLQQLQTRLESWLTPAGMVKIGNGMVLSSNVCIPVRGKTC